MYCHLLYTCTLVQARRDQEVDTVYQILCLFLLLVTVFSDSLLPPPHSSTGPLLLELAPHLALLYLRQKCHSQGPWAKYDLWPHFI